MAGTRWDWDYISEHISIGEVRDHPEEPWNRAWLSGNPGITLWDVSNLELPEAYGMWQWHILPANIPIEDVRDNSTYPWNKIILSQNPDITVEDIHTL